jgi:hypothetical protein
MNNSHRLHISIGLFGAYILIIPMPTTTYLPTHTPTYLPTTTYVPTHLPTYLLIITYLFINIPTHSHINYLLQPS